MVQPFGQRVYVTADAKAFVRAYNRISEVAMELDEADRCDGMAVRGEKFLIYVRPGADHSTYYHEALHMAHFIMEHCAQDINLESTETQAYLMEHIAESVRKKLC